MLRYFRKNEHALVANSESLMYFKNASSEIVMFVIGTMIAFYVKI